MVHDLCAIILEEVKKDGIIVAEINDNRCRYHPIRSKKQKIGLIRKGMCPVGYMSLYPFLFALHCSRDRTKLKLDIDRMVKQCPLGEEGATFKVNVEKIRFGLLEYVKNLARRLINLVIPCEVHDKNIVIEVIDKAAGCPLEFSKGDQFSFNIDRTDEMCPAAFNSVYPFLDLLSNNAVVGCPDYRTHVRFGTADYLRSCANERREHFDCDTYNARVQIGEKTDNFSCPVAVGKWYSIDELMGELGIRCFSSFHVAFPYLYTLYNGGQLGYLSRDRRKAGICCPSPLSVRYMVAKENDGAYKYNCLQSHNACPRGVELRDEVVVGDFEKYVSFYASLNEIYTVIKKMGSGPEMLSSNVEMKVPYQFGDDASLWVVRFGNKVV